MKTDLLKKIFQKLYQHLAILLLAIVLAPSVGFGQTYTTRAAGSWTNSATWVGGLVPSRNILSTMTVNINHQVTVNLDDDIHIYGTLTIAGDSLIFPISYEDNTFIYSTGKLNIINGGFLQNLTARKCEVNVYGGKVIIENSNVNIGKVFKATDGSERLIKNSTVRVGEDYITNGGSSNFVKDTIQYSTVYTSVTGGGHFDINEYTALKVANAKIYTGSGDFRVSDKSNIIALSNSIGGYGFNIIKTSNHLDNNGSWIAPVDAYCVGGDVKGSKAAEIDFTRPQDCTLTPTQTPVLGQLVINEVYTDPGFGKHEFIELYNMSNQPEPVDNYTLVTFFKNTLEEGFYVLDFPNLVVAPKSFFVGAAAFPFSYQGLNNSLAANFNWNNLLGTNNASLKKWIRSSVNVLDGNLYYDEAILPTSLNDLFNRMTGGGESAYTFLLYKNGVLVNQIIAGSGGNATISNTITSMPAMNVKMSGSAPDFTIDFSKYNTLPVEKITQDGGSDNGFIRSIDGGCNSWTKSSASSNHTPMESNGVLVAGTPGAVTISMNIVKGTSSTGSTVNYTVTGGSSSIFPIEMRVYVDNGTLPGQLDFNDTHVDTKFASAVGQSFSTKFFPFNADILIMTKQASGCIDNMQMARQSSEVTLPVKFASFTANLVQKTGIIKWSTSLEKDFSHFVLQRSIDGINYSDIATIFPTEGTVKDYMYKDQQLNGSLIFYYRIVGVDISGALTISQVRILKLTKEQGLILSTFPNPVSEMLKITLPDQWQGKRVSLQLVNSNGVVMQHINISNASQVEMLYVGNHAKGIYMLQASCDLEKLQSKIIKQ